MSCVLSRSGMRATGRGWKEDELGGEEGGAGRCTNTHYYGIITTSWARRYFVSLGRGDGEPFGGLLGGGTDGDESGRALLVRFEELVGVE